MLKAITEINFEQVIQSSSEKTLLVFIWASWCSNCKHQKPILEGLTRDEPDLAEYTSINAGEQTGLVKGLKVMGVPTIMLYRHGILVRKLLGVSSKKRLQKIMTEVSAYSREEAIENEYKPFWRKIMGR